MAIHSSILAWRIPWTEEPGRLQSMGLQRVGHHWTTNTSLHFAGGIWTKQVRSRGSLFRTPFPHPRGTLETELHMQPHTGPGTQRASFCVAYSLLTLSGWPFGSNISVVDSVNTEGASNYCHDTLPERDPADYHFKGSSWHLFEPLGVQPTQ